MTTVPGSAFTANGVAAAVALDEAATGALAATALAGAAPAGTLAAAAGACVDVADDACECTASCDKYHAPPPSAMAAALTSTATVSARGVGDVAGAGGGMVAPDAAAAARAPGV